MLRSLTTLILVVVLLSPAIAAPVVTIEMVPVGDPENSPDTRYGSYGAVARPFAIGKYEVTADQYTKFLNAVAVTDTHGLWNTRMGDPVGQWGCNIQRYGTPGMHTYFVAPEWAKRPVNYVSFWNACRFANWLQNGQPIGPQDTATTEDGAYTLTPDAMANNAVTRNPGAEWFLPSEDQWYKAAYYKGGGTGAGYWEYPTQSDSAPVSEAPPGRGEQPGSANYMVGNGYVDPVHYRTEVGAFTQSPGVYGTFDQAGNAWEWNEALIEDTRRGIRGGSFLCPTAAYSSASFRAPGKTPAYEDYYLGFRVAAVPEPGSIAMALAGGACLLAWAWRMRMARPEPPKTGERDSSNAA